MAPFLPLLRMSPTNSEVGLGGRAEGPPAHCWVKTPPPGPPWTGLQLGPSAKPTGLASHSVPRACPHPCWGVPYRTSAVISAQAWIHAQEMWPASRPSPFGCVAWPISLFSELLMTPACFPPDGRHIAFTFTARWGEAAFVMRASVCESAHISLSVCLSASLYLCVHTPSLTCVFRLAF